MENLHEWSERILGAKLLLCRIKDMGVNLFPEMKKEGKIYSNALYDCLMDLQQMDAFLIGEGEIHFSDHIRKGEKLISCKAHIK